MNQNTLRTVQRVSVIAFALCVCLTGWNSAAVGTDVVARGNPPMISQVSAVALPALGAMAGGITGLLAWLAKRWQAAQQQGGTLTPPVPNQPDAVGPSTLQILHAIAVLAEAGMFQQARELLNGIKQRGLPTRGLIQWGWADEPTQEITWGPKPSLTEIVGELHSITIPSKDSGAKPQ